jgi:hypothetical protein
MRHRVWRAKDDRVPGGRGQAPSGAGRVGDRTGRSGAELIREAVRRLVAVEPPRPRVPLVRGKEPIARKRGGRPGRLPPEGDGGRCTPVHTSARESGPFAGDVRVLPRLWPEALDLRALMARRGMSTEPSPAGGMAREVSPCPCPGTVRARGGGDRPSGTRRRSLWALCAGHPVAVTMITFVSHSADAHRRALHGGDTGRQEWE